MKTDSFAFRHLGPEIDLPKMLETIGVESLDQLLTRLFS
jgi:glycine dehydrogenase